MTTATQTWGLRVLALGLAIGLWFNFSFEAREAPAERLVEAPVSYNRPRGFIVLDPLPSVNVLYDRPASAFTPVARTEREQIRQALFSRLGIRGSGPVGFIVSPTSWTADEEIAHGDHEEQSRHAARAE